jgi:hypothetical protein
MLQRLSAVRSGEDCSLKKGCESPYRALEAWKVIIAMAKPLGARHKSFSAVGGVLRQ